MRRILNISLLIFISTECHGARPMRIKCQNPDARIKVNFQPSVMCNTWPSTALCERRLDPPLQSDLQLRPCFIMALTHNSSTQRSLGNARLGLIWSDSIFWRRQALSPWRCGSGSARTERNLSLNMSPCAIWTCKWVCFSFFFCRSEFAGWSGLWKARKGSLLCIIKCFPLEILHSFQYWV